MNLQTLWNELYNSQIIQANLNLELLNMKKELAETELYKSIQAKEREIIELENNTKENKQNIIDWLLKVWVKSIEFMNQKVSLRKSPWSIKVINEDSIPSDYFKEKVVRQLDKKMLKEWLNAWDVVPWATIEYSYSLLVNPK